MLPDELVERRLAASLNRNNQAMAGMFLPIGVALAVAGWINFLINLL
jgi:hypothetical protein